MHRSHGSQAPSVPFQHASSFQSRLPRQGWPRRAQTGATAGAGEGNVSCFQSHQRPRTDGDNYRYSVPRDVLAPVRRHANLSFASFCFCSCSSGACEWTAPAASMSMSARWSWDTDGRATAVTSPCFEPQFPRHLRPRVCGAVSVPRFATALITQRRRTCRSSRADQRAPPPVPRSVTVAAVFFGILFSAAVDLSTAALGVSAGELAALNDLRTSTGSAPALANWASGDPCGNGWYGVTCSGAAVT